MFTQIEKKWNALAGTNSIYDLCTNQNDVSVFAGVVLIPNPNSSPLRPPIVYHMQAHACRCMHVRPGSLAGVNRTVELLKAGGGGRTSFIYESEGGPRDWPNTRERGPPLVETKSGGAVSFRPDGKFNNWRGQNPGIKRFNLSCDVTYMPTHLSSL